MIGKEMLEKLQQMQSQADETKDKRAAVTVHGEAGGNLVTVELDGNKKLTNLSINTSLQQMEKEDLEDLLSVALNRAMDAADQINEKEMMEATKNMFTDL